MKFWLQFKNISWSQYQESLNWDAICLKNVFNNFLEVISVSSSSYIGKIPSFQLPEGTSLLVSFHSVPFSFSTNIKIKKVHVIQLCWIQLKIPFLLSKQWKKGFVINLIWVKYSSIDDRKTNSKESHIIYSSNIKNSWPRSNVVEEFSSNNIHYTSFL